MQPIDEEEKGEEPPSTHKKVDKMLWTNTFEKEGQSETKADQQTESHPVVNSQITQSEQNVN